MLNKTPLRLVVIGERARTEEHTPTGERPRSGERSRNGERPHTERPHTEDLGSAPLVQISDEEATTRKVPDAAMIAARDASADQPKRRPNWGRFVPAGAVAVVVVVIVLIAAFATRGRSGPASAGPVNATVPRTVDPAKPQPALVPVAAAPSATPATPETIRVRIAAAPVEAVLSLDGSVIAGHRLNLEVPKDRAIHVVSASAPGYIPFAQQVSFASDVVLAINLRRGRGAPTRQAGYTRPAQPEARPKGEFRPAALPSGPRMEPGMNLEGPPRRAGAKAIDERNPYKP